MLEHVVDESHTRRKPLFRVLDYMLDHPSDMVRTSSLQVRIYDEEIASRLLTKDLNVSLTPSRCRPHECCAGVHVEELQEGCALIFLITISLTVTAMQDDELLRCDHRKTHIVDMRLRATELEVNRQIGC